MFKVKRRRSSIGNRSAVSSSGHNQQQQQQPSLSSSSPSSAIKLKSILVQKTTYDHNNNRAALNNNTGGSSDNDSSVNYTDGGGSTTVGGGGSAVSFGGGSSSLNSHSKKSQASNTNNNHNNNPASGSGSGGCCGSSLGSSTNKTTTTRSYSSQTRRVRFRNVHFREFERVIGDNPSCSSGAPVSIGWAHGKDRTVRLDDYESTRPPRRAQLDLVLSRQDREDILLEWGASFSEIIDAIRSNIRVKNQRRNTVNTIGRYDRWEEMMERAGRKLKRTILLKKSTHKKQMEAYMYALQQQAGGGVGGNGGDANGHHHHVVTVDVDDDDVTVYTTMPIHEHHRHHHHHRPPPEIVSHHRHATAGTSTGNISNSSATTPDTIPAANPVDHPLNHSQQQSTSFEDDSSKKNRKICCLEANASIPLRRTSESSKHQEVNIEELLNDDYDDHDHDIEDRDNNVKDTNIVPDKMNDGNNTTNKDEANSHTNGGLPPVDGDNKGVNNTSGGGASLQQAGKQKQHQQSQAQEQKQPPLNLVHYLGRQELEELVVDPNVPLMEVDLLSHPSLPSYYSFSDDVSEYYMTGPGNVDDDDDDDGDDDNGGPVMTMNDWRILSTIQSGYALGHNHVLVVDTGTNSSSSSDVDRGFTSLRRDTSHWEVGGHGLDAPRICRRFVPMIISEDMSVMPLQDISSTPRMNMHLRGAAMNDNGSPIFHHGGTGGANDGPPIFHHHAGLDGSPIYHLGNHNVASSSSPQHHHHHRMMVDAAQQQAAPSQHQYLNQGFVMHPPPPHIPCQNSQYIARWE